MKAGCQPGRHTNPAFRPELPGTYFMGSRVERAVMDVTARLWKSLIAAVTSVLPPILASGQPWDTLRA